MNTPFASKSHTEKEKDRRKSLRNNAILEQIRYVSKQVEKENNRSVKAIYSKSAEPTHDIT